MSISDRVAVMRAGRVEQVGTPEEIYARPVSTYVARFIGSPQMELLSGELVRTGEQTRYRVGEVSFPVSPRVADALTETPVDVGIRPEHITLGGGDVPAIVRVVQPLGPMTYVSVGWADVHLTARLPGMVRLSPGQPVSIALDPDHLLFFDRASGRRIETDGNHG